MIVESKPLIERWTENETFKRTKEQLEKPRIKNLRIKDFSPAKLEDGSFDFRYVILKNVDFSDVDFRDTNFEGFSAEDCKFLRCNFANCSFVDAKFNKCDFHSCNLHVTNLLNANFIGGIWRELNIDWVNFHRVHLHDVRLTTIKEFFPYKPIDIIKSKNYLNFNIKPNKLIRAKQLIRNIGICIYVFISYFFKEDLKRFSYSEICGNYKSAYDMSKQLTILLQNTGNIAEANSAKFYSTRAMLFIENTSIFNKGKLWFDYSLGFYISPKHILFWSFFTIMVFATFFYANNDNYTYADLHGVCKSAQTQCVKIGDKMEVKLGRIEAVYFSAVTFATLGYGDIRPSKSNAVSFWQNFKIWIPAGEALIGAILMALFAVSLVRSDD